ncbi:hypothetical protein C1646_665275 [Rhizophagus diaphanus]|nr:hypothetical protein C1646_665275 [Rhizophagus diaphanus] [Rhizophagus sp. MUCL 43196]
MHDTTNQETPPISHNPASTTCHERKNGQRLIQEMSSSTKENHETKISETARSRKFDTIEAFGEQGLIQEISSFTEKNHETKISETARSRKFDTIEPSGGSMVEISQRLAQLCDKALIAEECALEANQEEILCWYHYGRNFIFQEKALSDKNKIGEKKAKGLIYDEVVKQLNILRLKV